MRFIKVKFADVNFKYLKFIHVKKQHRVWLEVNAKQFGLYMYSLCGSQSL